MTTRGLWPASPFDHAGQAGVHPCLVTAILVPLGGQDEVDHVRTAADGTLVPAPPDADAGGCP